MPPGPHGGNIDITLLTAGSTLYLPVQVDGALAYVGDPHFAQGDGEVSADRDGGQPARDGPARRGRPRGRAARRFGELAGPLAETTEFLVPTGMDEDLDVAVQHCVRAAIALLQARFGMDPRLAYAYLSAATDFRHLPGRRRRQGRARHASGSPTSHDRTRHRTAWWRRSGTTSARSWPTTSRRWTGSSPRARTRCAATATGCSSGTTRSAAFRAARGGAPQRTDRADVHVRAVDDDHALVVAVTELDARRPRAADPAVAARSPTGRARRLADHRRARLRVPAPALDTRVWRVVGDPLVPPIRRTARSTGETRRGQGPVRRRRASGSGAGNPAWLADAVPEPVHAARRRLGCSHAGASVRGIARTDEFAYSLAGTNAHYGTPPNPRRRYRISGGSSSGSASAVSLGHATIGLGTDTGGSIRVPAAYQGLFGIRTTHGARRPYRPAPARRAPSTRSAG